MNRRSMLAAAGTSLTVAVAGCSDMVSEDERQAYEFGIYNGSREARTITVRIGASSDGHFQDEVFEMDAETANESVPVEDTPSRITLQVDSSEERSFPWPASESDPGRIAAKADIWYEPSLEQDVLIVEG